MASLAWLNSNATRAYPLADDASQLSDAGIALPTNALLDIRVMCPAWALTARLAQFWASRSLAGVSIVSGGVPLASAVISKASYAPYTAVPLVPYTDRKNVSGWVVFGDWAPHAQRTMLSFSSDAQSKLARNAIRVVGAPPVTSIAKKGARAGDAASGLVRLEGDGYLKVARDAENAQRIILSIADPTKRAAFLGVCNQADCKVPPLRSINGVCPNSDGIITLRFEAAT